MERLETGDAFVLSVPELEIRRGRGGGGGAGRYVLGRFPYGVTATIRDRGRLRKERFGVKAFARAIERAEEEINLLAGHNFGQPLASKRAGSLKLDDTPEALTFEAKLPDKGPSWIEDTVLALEAGLAVGVSPGFRVPPLNVVPDAEVEVPEPGNPGVFIRQINQAMLYELSIVTRPAYSASSAEVEARAVAYSFADPERRRLWL